MRTQFEIDLEDLINKYSMENGSDTPDFILAKYLYDCLQNFDVAVKRREEWYGRQPKISDLAEGVPLPTDLTPIIELDNQEPIIDYDSTGTVPENLKNFPTTGDKPDIMPSTTSSFSSELQVEIKRVEGLGIDLLRKLREMDRDDI